MKSARIALPVVALALASCSSSKAKPVEHAKEASVACTSPLTEGEITLDPDEVHSVVAANSQLLGNCYDRALAENPALQGEIQVNLVVGADGRIQQVCSGGSTVGSDQVVACVIRTFSAFQFSEQGHQVATVYPVAFYPH
jgi:hypothetical protein